MPMLIQHQHPNSTPTKFQSKYTLKMDDFYQFLPFKDKVLAVSSMTGHVYHGGPVLSEKLIMRIRNRTTADSLTLKTKKKSVLPAKTG
uniref:Uncharacterized protein n=1 Tax=Panagrellus redivivus TaxID=6233 RepID=A0A7E4V0B8_PANRE